MEFEILKTERLLLRKVTPEVYKHVFQSKSEEEIKSFFNCNGREDFEKERHRFEKGLSTYNRTFLYFQLIDASTNLNIGWCGYHTWYLDHERAELGYGFTNMEFEGQGLMSEATKIILDYGFKEMNLHRVEAMASPANPKSLALLERFKFIKEGHLREHYMVKGKAEDSLVFSLLKSEHAF